MNTETKFTRPAVVMTAWEIATDIANRLDSDGEAEREGYTGDDPQIEEDLAMFEYAGGRGITVAIVPLNDAPPVWG